MGSRRAGEEAGVTPLLHRLCVAPIMENGVIGGVITESKAGREAILAKRVIDATGDADIATRAGAPVLKTPKEEDDGGVRHVFHVAASTSSASSIRSRPIRRPTPTGRAMANGTTRPPARRTSCSRRSCASRFKKALDAGIIPPYLHTIAGTWGTVTDQGDLTYLNLVHVPEIDGTDPNDLTIGEMRGRREAIYALEALRKFMPGCEDAKLRNFGMTLGIRDTRKIDALYNLTGNDVREQARFDDAIGIFPEFIDGYGILILPTTGRYWHVPYRALVPKGVGNLLVAGRCIGGDKISHASARNMMCCAVSGQGAGVAAAVSLQRNEPLRPARHRRCAERACAPGRALPVSHAAADAAHDAIAVALAGAGARRAHGLQQLLRVDAIGSDRGPLDRQRGFNAVADRRAERRSSACPNIALAIFNGLLIDRYRRRARHALGWQRSAFIGRGPDGDRQRRTS